MSKVTEQTIRQVLGSYLDAIGRVDARRGVIPRFGYVHHGVCFQCEGRRVVPLPQAAERVALRAVGLA